MAIRAKCPHCGYTFALHERALGRALACPSCEHEIKLPSKEEVEVAKAKKAATTKSPASAASRAPTLKARAVGVQPAAGNSHEQVGEEKKPKKRRKKKHEFNHEEAWDITPMVDVAFLLLIFFMVTNSFSIQKVIRTARQVSDKGSTNAQVQTVEKANFVTVQIDDQDAFSVVSSSGGQEDAFSKQDLILILARVKEEGGEEMTDLTVEAHEDSTHGAVVAALDAGRAANFTKFKTTVVEQFQ